MKLMKHITIALVLCAIPAMVFGQDVTCDDCSHTVSVYMGTGGFVATADGADMVTYVASCGGVTRSGELEADDDGVVSGLFTMDNGLACHAEGGEFELGPVMDGGWFWINDADNSAVGNLVANEILDNDTVDLTEAGGVEMTMGKGAVYLKHGSGRVGILPNILPDAPADPAAICGPRANTAWPFAYDRQSASGCMLGGGRTKIRLVGPGAFGSAAMITNGMVYRPRAGTITVTADLWVDETGSYSTATDNAASNGPSAASIQKGWNGKTASALGAGSGTNWLTATFSASVAAAVGAPVMVPADGSAAVAGVTVTNTGSTEITPAGAADPNPVGQAVFTIGPDASYCSRTANHTAVVNIAAVPAAAAADPTNLVHPPVAVGNNAGLGRSAAVATFAAITPLRVVCPPASSANQGQELVPDNPFPVD